MAKPQRDRRSRRPVTGDTRLCPFCRVGTMQFFEEPPAAVKVEPAWICQSGACGYRTLARQTSRATRQKSASERAHALKERSVAAHRKAMKVHARAETLQRQSQRITTRRRKKR